MMVVLQIPEGLLADVDGGHPVETVELPEVELLLLTSLAGRPVPGLGRTPGHWGNGLEGPWLVLSPQLVRPRPEYQLPFLAMKEGDPLDAALLFRLHLPHKMVKYHTATHRPLHPTHIDRWPRVLFLDIVLVPYNRECPRLLAY